LASLTTEFYKLKREKIRKKKKSSKGGEKKGPEGGVPKEGECSSPDLGTDAHKIRSRENPPSKANREKDDMASKKRRKKNDDQKQHGRGGKVGLTSKRDPYTKVDTHKGGDETQTIKKKEATPFGKVRTTFPPKASRRYSQGKSR